MPETPTEAAERDGWTDGRGNQLYYTEAELTVLREQHRRGHEAMKTAVRARGVGLHPRVAAAHTQVEEQDG